MHYQHTITIDKFIRENSIRPADAVVVKKEPYRLLDHYIIYLGMESSGHIFIANYTWGTKILTEIDLIQFATEFSVDRIRRFQGNELQRHTAVHRALSRRDQSSYHLLYNNCEHFSNYVQTGSPFSQQTKTLGAGLVLTGLTTAAASRNPSTQTVGLITTVLGLVTLWVDHEINGDTVKAPLG